METSLANDIKRGLLEKRENLDEWCESCSQDELVTHLGQDAESIVQTHLHVIDESLQKLEAGVLGVCEVCHEAVEQELLQMDYTTCVCLGHYTDAELRQLESELELSQVIQRGLLPQTLPTIEGLNIAAFSRPAQIVGGDYFDFVNFKDGAHGLVMADVSGHGVSAGMFMSSLQTAFQTLVPDTDSPPEVLERINRLYIHNINFTTFVTVFFGKYEPRTGILSYANAGHNSAYLYRMATNQEIWLRPTGPAIGLMEGFVIRKEDIKLESGDILLLYTDGITEASNHQGALWGEDNLADIIRANANSSAEQLIQKILKAMKDHTGENPLADDVTLVITKVA